MTVVRDKRVLITGAGHGLGRAIAERFARAGAEVIVTDRDPARAAAVAQSVNQSGGRTFAYPLDVTSAEEVRAVRERVRGERGPVDILVNNAGVVYGGPFLKVPLERHRSTVEVNLLGVLTVTHAFLPDLINRPEGHIVNIASAAAVVALPWAASYSATKWALLGFSDSLREELRLQSHLHVRVTAICPSYIDTGLFTGARPARLTRLLKPETVADATLRAVERNREMVLLPRTVQMFYRVARHLPRGLYRRVCGWLGISASMVECRGHATDAPCASS
jgi:all-trans-retinol dehydrogenase (NAD+)